MVSKCFTKKLNLTMTDLFSSLHPFGTIVHIVVRVIQLY